VNEFFVWLKERGFHPRLRLTGGSGVHLVLDLRVNKIASAYVGPSLNRAGLGCLPVSTRFTTACPSPSGALSLREVFLRAAPLLDLEGYREDQAEKQRRQIQGMANQLAPEAFGRVLELMQSIGENT
jgi:hypothetical protein